MSVQLGNVTLIGLMVQDTFFQKLEGKLEAWQPYQHGAGSLHGRRSDVLELR